MDLKHQNKLNVERGGLLRFCFRCEAGQPEEGDGEQRDGSGSSITFLPITHLYSLIHVLTAAAAAAA